MNQNVNPPNNYAKVVAKAWADPGFRQRLTADPKTTLKAEGWFLPDDISITIKPDTAESSFVLGLPPRPVGIKDEQLQDVADQRIPWKVAIPCC